MYKVGVITGSRADYGIMKKLIYKLNNDKNILLYIVATGMHLEKKYGYTYRQIENDGFKINKKIKIDLLDSNKGTIVRSMSLLQNELSNLFNEINFDLLIILGDRFEMLATASAALIYNIPICHLHGGEKTLGNFDEYIRHSITKMSHLHLVSTEEYRNRIIQLGENPNMVVNTGSLGVENILNTKILSKRQLLKDLNVDDIENYYVVMYHPETLNNKTDAEIQVNQLILALSMVEENIIFIGSNSDVGSDNIMKKILSFVNENKNSYYFTSLASNQFYSLISHSLGLIGNSSSGIIEVPSLNKPTLNIGERQKGRLSGPSVINVNCEANSILDGIKAMRNVTDFYNPYMQSNSTDKAYEAIKIALSNNIDTKKDFYDLTFKSKHLL